MALIVEFYLNTFVPLYETCEHHMVDISKLINRSKTWSPVQLSYEPKEESVRLLGAVMIVNFCKTYAETKMFPKIGIETFTKIISSESPDVDAQKILMVHLTKRCLHINLFNFILIQTDNMKIKREMMDDEEKWIKLATNVINHEKINEIIDRCIESYGLVSKPIEDDVRITLIEHGTKELRGFVGFNEIFVNAKHFRKKINDFEDDEDLLQMICKMDIASLALHELAHLKIRKSTGNFNMHSPILAAANNLPPNFHEFGVFVEHTVFGTQVDWFSSRSTVDRNYMEMFIKAIENQTELPAGSIDGAVPRASTTDIGGADIQLNVSFC